MAEKAVQYRWYILFWQNAIHKCQLSEDQKHFYATTIVSFSVPPCFTKKSVASFCLLSTCRKEHYSPLLRSKISLKMNSSCHGGLLSPEKSQFFYSSFITRWLEYLFLNSQMAFIIAKNRMTRISFLKMSSSCHGDFLSYVTQEIIVFLVIFYNQMTTISFLE